MGCTVSAELAARRTAAAAVLADFRREEVGSLSFGGPSAHDWLALAQRLAWALGDVLSELDRTEQGPALSPGQLAVIGQVLTDAITYRDPSGACTACEDHPAGLCEDHAADLDKTDAYLALARELGVEMEQ